MFLQPRTLQEAVEVLATHGGTLVAGGTDVFPALVDRPTPACLVDLSQIADLKGIRLAGDHVRIGGGATWTEIIEADLPPCFSGLKAASREVGSVQIQNRGTIAGNLCNASPAADGVPPLLALDAAVELTSREGTRCLSLADFILGNRRTARRPGEILSAVLVPRAWDKAGSAFQKLGARRYLVISILMVAATIARHRDGSVRAARVAVGAASEVARRLPALEGRLIGASTSTRLSSLIAADDLAVLSPIDDVRASADYRLTAARELVGRTIDLAAGALADA
ncbi:MAG: FAD binding domain-containing protein [Xanthobacteraceae bacterium]